MHFHPFFLLFIFSILVTSLASPWEDVNLKHKWATIPENWQHLGFPDTDTTIDIHIALKAQHENALIDALYEVSTPDHPRHGKHLSKEQVDELVAPPQDVIELVHAWLDHHGVHPSTISTELGGSLLVLSGVSVPRANALLNASYQFYQHVETNETVLRTLSYGLPAVLHALVHCAIPATHFGFSQIPRKQPPVRPGREGGAPDKAAVGKRKTESLSSRDLYVVTPSLLRWQYGTFGYEPAATLRNVLGIGGYLNDYPNEDDLMLFMNGHRTEGTFATYTVIKVNDGGYDPGHPTTEGDMYIQYAEAMVYPTTVVFYSTGGTTFAQDPFIAWMKYVLRQTNVPQTVSTSYSAPEYKLPRDYALYSCYLYAQLGARGSSVLFPSSNEGVGAGDCKFKDSSGATIVRFVPAFPSTCPFVTSVGGTTGHDPEVAAEISGGGFSDYFLRPMFQEYAVPTFLNNFGNHYPGLFNTGGRGFPDIAAQAFNFLYIFNKIPWLMNGTSCATPTAAGIISLLNDRRLSKGKTTLGWLNPMLYSVGRPGLNDIIFGSNPGCNTPGFPAIPGWDPVTGLGSLKFEKLIAIVDNMP